MPTNIDRDDENSNTGKKLVNLWIGEKNKVYPVRESRRLRRKSRHQRRTFTPLEKDFLTG